MYLIASNGDVQKVLIVICIFSHQVSIFIFNPQQHGLMLHVFCKYLSTEGILYIKIYLKVICNI